MGVYSEEEGEHFPQDKYWTLNSANKNMMVESTFGGYFVKVICNIIVNLEKLLTSKSFEIIFVQ